MKIDKEERILINILINHKLRDYLEITGDSSVEDFYYTSNLDRGELLLKLSPKERLQVKKIFKLKEKVTSP